MRDLFFKPAPHFILMVGDDGVLLVPHQLPDQAFLFAAHSDKKKTGAIQDLIDLYPHASVTILADMLAQDFRPEKIPKLNIFDRPKLIHRRLQQAFPQAKLRAHLNTPSDPTQILMIGLHDSAPVFIWLEKLKHRLPRLGLIPVEGVDLLRALLPDAMGGWAMMLSRQSTGGFRQIVTHKGVLVFTRLTPPEPPDADAALLADIIQRDMRATLGYLSRLGLTDSTQLRAILLLHETAHESLSDIPLPIPSVTLLSPRKAAQGLGLPFALHADETGSDLLFAGHFVRQGRLRLPLMLPPIRHAVRQAAIKKAGTYVAIAALAFALITSVWQTGDIVRTILATQREATQTAELKNQLVQEREAAAPVTEPLGRLRQALERQRLFAAPTVLPWDILNSLQKGLGDTARLVKMEWKNSEGGETLHASLRLSHPPGEEESHQQIVADFQSTVQNITVAMPSVHVSVTRYPFAALPDEQLSNNSGSSGVHADEALTDILLQRSAP